MQDRSPSQTSNKVAQWVITSDTALRSLSCMDLARALSSMDGMSFRYHRLPLFLL